jgi:phage baseplate assembly protein W
MTIAETLGTTYFQLSTVGVGALAVGVADIRQRIYNVLNTIPGTDPLRPLFGSYAYQWTDKPLADAIPNIKKNVYDALSTWMPEIQVTSLTHNIINEAQVGINITYALIDSELTDTITWSNGVVTGDTINSIILTANVPVHVTNGIYRVAFIVNGEAVNPPIPGFGFESANEMLIWVTANWSNYGRWYLTATSLILYLNSGIADTASLTVTETAEITLKQLIPVLGSGDFYNLGFSIDGGDPVPAFPADTFTTIGSMLTWVTDNWSIYGNWNVIAEATGGGGGSGDFSDDLSDDFGTEGGAFADYYLVFQSANFTTATLNFS